MLQRKEKEKNCESKCENHQRVITSKVNFKKKSYISTNRFKMTETA